MKLVLSFVLTLFSFALFAQGGTIRGFVYDKETGDAVIFASVSLEGTSYGVSTDVEGYFSLSEIPVGDYTIEVSSIEYTNTSEAITIAVGKVVTKNFYLKPGVVNIDAAEIRADRTEQQTTVRMSVETITPKSIRQLPSIGGQPDLAQYLQVLPGVVTTGDQGGQLYIRGGSPIQNKVLLDGMIIYNPFHSIGLFSVFDTDVIRNADIYTGGFGARYGGRISSIMDITTKDGNKKRMSGRVGVSPFAARILLEGPLKPQVNANSGSISYILSAKHSYLNKSSQVLYDYALEDGLPFTFTDLYGKVTFAGNQGSKVSLFGFNYKDDVRYQGVSDLGWNNYGGGGTFVVIPSGSPVLISGNLAFSNYEIRLVEAGVNEDRFSAINSFNFGLDFKRIMGEDDIRYGFEAIGFATDYQTINSIGVKSEQEENTTELGAYVQYKKSAGKFLVEPSIRLQYYASLSRPSLEPRIGIKFKANEVLRFKAAAGVYSQNLISATSDRDVVNLFYGFLAGPQNLQDEFVLEDGTVREIESPLQRANHLIFGFEYDINEKLNLNVEGYVKDFRQITNVNRNKLFPETEEYADSPDRLKKDFIVETGKAKGIDFVLKYTDKRTNIWLVYSLGKSDRWDGLVGYAPVFDRRHNANFVSSYAFGKDNSWEASLRWNVGSGLAFTPIQGFFQPGEFEEGVGTNVGTENTGELGILYGEINSSRLPYYHRLDLNVKKKVKMQGKRELELNAGVTNAYDRNNIFYINPVTNQRIDQLPILPSIGVDFKF